MPDSNSILWFWGPVAFGVASGLFEIYLERRAYNRCQRMKVPDEIKEVVSDEDFRKANLYAADKNKFNGIKGVYDIGTNLVVLRCALFPKFWNWTYRVVKTYVWKGLKAGTIPHSLCFIAAGTALSLLDLPWGLYSTFVIEERHGFNKQTLKGFLLDLLKSQCLTLVIGLPLAALFIWIIESFGEYFYVVLLVAIILVNLIGSFVYPYLIQPLFNKFTPLSEGDLKTKIEALAGKVGFPLKKLLVVDGSQRSAHSNAYLYGFWKNKRIVLYDTLLEDMKEDDNQLLAVLAHELGHWNHSHTWKLMGVAFTYSLVMLYCYKLTNTTDHIYELFGFDVQKDGKPTFVGLTLFLAFAWSPVDHIFSFAMHFLYRRFEHQADGFAAELGFADPLKSGLIKINVKNKGAMDPDPLYSIYHHTHPPLLHRLRYITEKAKKSA